MGIECKLSLYEADFQRKPNINFLGYPNKTAFLLYNDGDEF